MEATAHGWKIFDAQMPVLTCEYSFGPGVANALAVGGRTGLVVVSPPWRAATGVFDDLARFGPARALVASNGTVACSRASEVTLKSAIVVSNFTCVAVEKPDPLMTTCVPGLPVAGEKLLTTGAAQVTGPAR